MWPWTWAALVATSSNSVSPCASASASSVGETSGTGGAGKPGGRQGPVARSAGGASVSQATSQPICASQWAVIAARTPPATKPALSLPLAVRMVVTGGTGEVAQALARFAAADLAALTGWPVAVLAGGTAAWAAAGRPLATGEAGVLSPRIDRYRRPYEGTDAPRSAMQAYLDWEFGLVAQLGRDGTHGFQVLAAA